MEFSRLGFMLSGGLALIFPELGVCSCLEGRILNVKDSFREGLSPPSIVAVHYSVGPSYFTVVKLNKCEGFCSL